MDLHLPDIPGLTPDEVQRSREKHGDNSLDIEQENRLWRVIKDLIKEPMLILLLVAAAIYFITGNVGDGLFMVAAIGVVSAISLFQDQRSRNALENLQNLTQPNCKVIRSGKVQEIHSHELVIGDMLMVEEGGTVAADGEIVHSNDFSVDESMLTGESLSVFKDADSKDNQVYSGTWVAGGLAIARVTAIGNQTQLGKIGSSLENIQDEKTPLEIQIGSFVKWMVILGAVVFVLVWGINFLLTGNILDSLLKSLTLAMSILPEEIPVAFTTFMALGAWRLMKLGIVVKQMKTVETLGSATVICADKTGTLTMNKMSLAKTYVPESTPNPQEAAWTLIRTAMFASEPIPFDPMETALHQAYEKLEGPDERPDYKMVHEYPLGGTPPMMTHVFEHTSGERIIAAKGAPEAIIHLAHLTVDEKKQALEALEGLAREGYRVLGVGVSPFEGQDYPATQQELPFTFLGLVAFYDPPKENIRKVLSDFYDAGINVKIITGDNAVTTQAIARQIDFRGVEKHLSGEALMQLSDEELEKEVENTQLFTRMFPEAKLRIINALKARKEVVAMTGDGVNDGPALKAAHIGIAMGKRGTEIAKQAASLILADDDLGRMVEAVAMGRKIYTNLKKAIRYIISIHIPIILTVLLPLALGWIYPHIFTPVHIILLELIMGPTCSIVFENEPIEKNTMQLPPRPFTTTFFKLRELSLSIVQGLGITLGTLVTYQLAVQMGLNEGLTRAMVFTSLMAANILLTLVNRSFYYSIFTTLKYKNNLIPWVLGITLLVLGLLLYVPPLTRFFDFETISLSQLGISLGIGAASVLWFELIKWGKRIKGMER